MPRHPRSKVVRKGEPGIFHVTVRCVRQYRLLGVDTPSRGRTIRTRVWILDRLRKLVSCFGGDAPSWCQSVQTRHMKRDQTAAV